LELKKKEIERNAKKKCKKRKRKPFLLEFYKRKKKNLVFDFGNNINNK
jgi:hypothetical protein